MFSGTTGGSYCLQFFIYFILNTQMLLNLVVKSELMFVIPDLLCCHFIFNTQTSVVINPRHACAVVLGTSSVLFVEALYFSYREKFPIFCNSGNHRVVNFLQFTLFSTKTRWLF